MPRHHHHQSLRAGYSLVELLIGAALTGLLALVMARMMIALVRGSQYATRQAAQLASSRRSLNDAGPHRGMIWAAQEAEAALSLSTSTLQLTLPVLETYDYEVVASTLMKTQNGSGYKQAANVSSMTLSYFEIDSTGHIFRSTVAAQASLVQVLLTVRGKTSKDRTYSILSAAWLRNR